MNRTLPFMLNVLRNGTSQPSKLFFATEGEMLAKVQDILKRPFVGKMQGFVWEPGKDPHPGDWTLLQKVEEMQYSDTFEERGHIFSQAATFLKAMAKNKTTLTTGELSELRDLLDELFSVYEAEEKRQPAPPEEIQIKEFTSINMA